MASQVHDTAGEAVAERGVVMLEGPEGTALSLTPAAAKLTGESLLRAAICAERQQRQELSLGSSEGLPLHPESFT